MPQPSKGDRVSWTQRVPAFLAADLDAWAKTHGSLTRSEATELAIRRLLRPSSPAEDVDVPVGPTPRPPGSMLKQPKKAVAK